MSKILVIIGGIASLLVACSVPSKVKISDKEVFEKCEEQYKTISDNNIKKMIKSSQIGAGNAGSYFLSGTAYGIEYTIKIVAGLTVGTIICSPMVVASQLSTSQGGMEAASKCLGGVSHITWDELLGGEKFGKKIYRSTEKWRCPNIDKLSQTFRKVAHCYQENNYKEKAREQLQKLVENQLIKNCTSEEEWFAINKDLNQINTASLIK